MEQLRLSFLGTFQAQLGEKVITHFRSANVQGLLVYLAMHAKRPFPRDVLAALFWPDSSENIAKTNLRQTLYQLRKVLNDRGKKERPFLLVNRQTVQFNIESNHTLDVDSFLSAIERGDLETAVELYHGELLQGLSFKSSEFESWLRQQREHFHQLTLEAMRDLAERQLVFEAFAKAQQTARKQLAIEPWREIAHQQLMQALALSGNRDGALAQFEICQDQLESALGISPTQTTFDLVLQIEKGDLSPKKPSQADNDFVISEKIGEGAMGIIYRGKMGSNGQDVVIKMLDPSRLEGNPEALQRFQREGEALKKLNHPNIVKFFQMVEKEGNHYLLMEYIDGGDLRSLISQQTQLPIRQILSIGIGIADALTRSHRLSILHRDIKPGNILLSDENTPLLADFGIARLGREQKLTQHGSPMGTYAYMSPEQFSDGAIDQRSDIWSFGVLLIEMLIGHNPFSQSTIPATISAIINHSIPDLTAYRSDIPIGLFVLIEKMLSKEPNQRISSARQIGAELEDQLQSVDDDGEYERLTSQYQSVPTFANQSHLEPTTVIQGVVPKQAPSLPDHFVGREELIEQVSQALKDKTAVSLVGMGGIGKTTLASAIAHHNSVQFPDGILWANVHNSSTESILALWSRAYGYDFSGLTDVDSLKTAVQGILANKKTLLILDNVDDASQARPLMVHGPQCALLLTTRNMDIASTLNCTSFRLQELLAIQSQQLLTHILGEDRIKKSAEEEEASLQIGKVLNHLPLAIEIAAQRLKSRPRMNIADMVSRLQLAQRRIGLEISDQAIRSSFQISWLGLDSELKRVFSTMGLFAGRPFTIEILANILNQDYFDVEDAVYSLTALSLVNEVDEDRYRQHLLLADYANEVLEGQETAVSHYISTYLTFAQDFQKQFDQLDSEWENINSAIQQAHDTEQWQTVVDLTDTLAGSWMQYGRYLDANHNYQLALTASQKIQSPSNLAQTLIRQAEILIEQSKYKQAWDSAERGLDIYYQIEYSPGIIKAKYLQGFILFDQGRFVESKEILLEGHSMSQSIEDLELKINILLLLARLFSEIETEGHKADLYVQEAVSLLGGLGENNVSLAILELLITIEIRNDNYAKAENLASHALTLGKSLNNKAQIGAISRLLVIIYRLQEKYLEAKALAEDCIQIFRHLGNERFQGMAITELSQIHLKLNEFDEALMRVRQGLQIYEKIEERVGYAFALLIMGDIYASQKDIQTALEAWSESKEIASHIHNEILFNFANERIKNIGI